MRRDGVERRLMGECLLEGVRVLDLTQFLAGPFGSQILADLGADVVKIEPPKGDSSRHIAPHFVAGDSAYFHAVNRSKRSVVLDLKSGQGRELFLRLVETHDVVFENFRPGVMGRLGLDWETLRERNPRLIGCSISGFGQDGPRRDQPAYDAMVQALAGGMSLTGHPGAPPARLGLPVGDLAAGMYAAVAIAAALLRRERTGEGDYLDISMFDCQIAMLGYQATYYLHSGEVPGPQGAGHVSIPTYRCFKCADDRWVMVTASTERMWVAMCEALELDDLLADPRFATNALRLQHRQALWERLESRYAELLSARVVDLLARVAVPVAPVNDVARALSDPQVSARNMVIHLDGPDGATVGVLGNPIKSASSATALSMPATFPPRLGADTEAVLRERARATHAEILELAESWGEQQ
jgi:CoA:oxalate CoA-transferase